MVRGEYFEILENFPAVFDRRIQLCGVGTALARPQPCEYVPGRRHLLSHFRQIKSLQAPSVFTGAEYLGRGFHHFRRTAGRTACKPGLPGLGLPGYAFEFSWADLPAFFPFMDPPESDWYAAIPPCGQIPCKIPRKSVTFGGSFR